MKYNLFPILLVLYKTSNNFIQTGSECSKNVGHITFIHFAIYPFLSPPVNGLPDSGAALEICVEKWKKPEVDEEAVFPGDQERGGKRRKNR